MLFGIGSPPLSSEPSYEQMYKFGHINRETHQSTNVDTNCFGVSHMFGSNALCKLVLFGVCSLVRGQRDVLVDEQGVVLHVGNGETHVFWHDENSNMMDIVMNQESFNQSFNLYDAVSSFH